MGSSLVAAFMEASHLSAGCGLWALTCDLLPLPVHFVGAAAESRMCSIRVILYRHVLPYMWISWRFPQLVYLWFIDWSLVVNAMLTQRWSLSGSSIRHLWREWFEEKMTACNVLVFRTARLSLCKPVHTQDSALFQTWKRQLKMWTAVWLESL